MSLLMTIVGWVRPPIPTTVAGGSAFPDERTVTDGPVISVVVRLALAAPPGRNSATVPLTRTASPTDTAGAELVKTKIASEVASLESGSGSWIQKPLPDVTVTIPVVFSVLPARGERCAAPWMSWIGTGGAGGASVVKLKTKSPAMLSGGSMASWSVTCAAMTVTVQDSLFAKSRSGFSVKVVGPPETVAVCAPLEAQLIENHEPATFTASENVIATLAEVATFVAASAGFVDVTVGAASAPPVLLSGSGAAAVKSVALLSVSIAPPPRRIAAVVLPGA